MNKFPGTFKVAVVAALLGLTLTGCNKTSTDPAAMPKSSSTAPAPQTNR